MKTLYCRESRDGSHTPTGREWCIQGMQKSRRSGRCKKLEMNFPYPQQKDHYVNFKSQCDIYAIFVSFLWEWVHCHTIKCICCGSALIATKLKCKYFVAVISLPHNWNACFVAMISLPRNKNTYFVARFV